MGHMNREILCREYVLKLEKEFQVQGHDVAWAPSTSGPTFWGEEDSAIDLANGDPNKSNVESSAMAVSPDQKLLAVATNAVIRIYDIQTRDTRSALIGHPANVWKVRFAPSEPGGETAYRLLSESAKVSGNVGEIIIWSLDSSGNQVSTRDLPAFNSEAMAQTALSAISPELHKTHAFSNEELEAVRLSITSALIEGSIQVLLKGLKSFHGHFPTFNTDPFSHDGTEMLYLTHNKTTQNGIRPAKELPQIKTVTFPALKPLHTLSGHTDAIMSAAFSPDGKLIASASWDQTFRLWSTSTGECLHTIGPTGTQNWAVAFSPEEDRVLLSGAQKPTQIGLYDVATSEQIARLEHPDLDHWLRYFQWSPDGKEVVVINKRSLLLWRPPLTGGTGNGSVVEVLKLESDGSMLENFCQIASVKWADEGRKLIARTTEATVFIWDHERNVKWRFQRPKGTPLSTGGETSYARIAGNETVVSLDGDKKVRFWKL